MEGLAASLQAHQRIGIDTSVFIYHIEDVRRYTELTDLVFDDLAHGVFEGVTSILTLMELVVRPLQLNKPETADEYEVLMSSYPHLAIAGHDRLTARRAAELRARYRLRPADALQIASCLQHGATAFLTNDLDLRRVGEITVLALDDFLQP